MSEQDVEHLKTACQKAVRVSEKLMLEAGETIWLAGRPAPSTKDTVALEMGNGQTVTIQEKDIVTAQKDRERFLVQVRTGSEVLYRFEGVSQIRPRASKCNCDKAMGQAQRTAGSGDLAGNGDTIIIDCTPICTIQWVCNLYVDGAGYVRQLCLPYLICVNPCDPGPIV